MQARIHGLALVGLFIAFVALGLFTLRDSVQELQIIVDAQRLDMDLRRE